MNPETIILLVSIVSANGEQKAEARSFPTMEKCQAEKKAEGTVTSCVEVKLPPPVWNEAGVKAPPFDRPIEVIARGQVPNLPKGVEYGWQGVVQFMVHPTEGEWSPTWRYLPKGANIVFWREPTAPPAPPASQ